MGWEVSHLKLPKRIKINGHQVSHDTAVLSDCLGLYDENKGNPFIKIDSGLKGLMLADTTLHEQLHAIFHLAEMREDDDEERIVSVFATQITMLFAQNPKYADWWFELIKQK